MGVPWKEAILAGIASLFCLFASQAAAQELSIWGLGLDENQQGMLSVIQEFESRNPGVQIKLLSMGAGRMNPQKLMTSIVGGVPPDVMYQDRFTISDWASRGAFEQLDTLIERDKRLTSCPRKTEYLPGTWEEASYQGRLYAIPVTSDNRALYYNKTIFREKATELRAAGLDPERPPITWDELLAYNRVLTQLKPDGTLLRAGFLPNYGSTWLYLYAYQNGASFISADGLTCRLQAPETIEALSFMAQGYEISGGYENAQRFQASFASGALDAFGSGKLAMIIQGNWALGRYARFAPNLDFGVAAPPLPKVSTPKERTRTWSGGFCWAIPKGTRQKELAWKFIQFAASIEGRLIEVENQSKAERTKGGIFIPRISAHIPTNLVLLNQFAPPNPALGHALRVHMELAPRAAFRPPTPVGQALWDAQARAIERACRKEVTSSQALEEAEGKVQNLLDETHKDQLAYPLNIQSVLRVLAFCGSFLVMGLAWILASKLRKQSLTSRRETCWGYLMISPWALGFFIFIAGPMLASLFWSFTRYNALTPPHWVGLQNYAQLLTSDQPILLKSLSNVLFLAVVGIPLGLISGLFLALLVHSTHKMSKLYAGIFYLPTMLPGVASSLLWMWVLLPDPERGLLAHIWSRTLTAWFSIPSPGWYLSESWAKPSLIVMGLWGIGGGVLFWLAGLRRIPDQLYEAALLDGASPSLCFWWITLPQLRPILGFQALIALFGIVQLFEAPYVLTGGQGYGPGDVFLTPVYYLFQNAFGYFKMGYASALAWLLFFVIFLISFFGYRLARVNAPTEHVL